MDSLEVRCCCDAGKIMGWWVTDGLTAARLRINQKLQFPTDTGVVELEVRTVYSNPLKLLLGDRGVEAIALKSNDYPMEQLKQIPGFVENPQAGPYIPTSGSGNNP